MGGVERIKNARFCIPISLGLCLSFFPNSEPIRNRLAYVIAIVIYINIGFFWQELAFVINSLMDYQIVVYKQKRQGQWRGLSVCPLPIPVSFPTPPALSFSSSIAVSSPWELGVSSC